MSIIVTGGAGFIGSCVVRTLNDAGVGDVIVVDDIAQTDKWKNLRNKKYLDYIHKSEFLARLPALECVAAVIHMGACSDTTQRDFDYLWKNNFGFSKALYGYCLEKQIPFIYASSAATYGDGSRGFDDAADIRTLRPLNGYGYSKQVFDLWVEQQAERPLQCVGLKFFNVYGPNEYFKGSMASMFFHGYRQIAERGSIRLFKSHRPEYADGEQLRDFVYVKDVCSVIEWLMENPKVSGLFNVGTGQARSFRALAESVFHALDLEPNIEYIDMPEALREKYQYYTRAEMKKLRGAGYLKPFTDIEKGAADYVRGYLHADYRGY